MDVALGVGEPALTGRPRAPDLVRGYQRSDAAHRAAVVSLCERAPQVPARERPVRAPGLGDPLDLGRVRQRRSP